MEACRITVGSVWGTLQAPGEVIAGVRSQMRALDPKALHTWAYKNGRSDGMVDFTRLGPRGLEFQAGLAYRVANTVKLLTGTRPVINWPQRKDLQALCPALDREGMDDREHQDRACEKFRAHPMICLQFPPRTGKTEVGIEFVRYHGGRTLWVTHLDTLIKQTPERFAKRMPDVPVLVVKSGRGVGDPNAPVVVGMIQTLHRMVDETPEWFAQFDNLVMDEAHHAGAETWQKVANACVNATRRLGLSGTMGTSNIVSDLRIEGALGPTYIVAETSEMADKGYLAQPIVRVLRAPPSSYPRYEDIREAVAPNWRKDPQGILGKLGGELYRVTYERGVIQNRERSKLIIATAIRHAEIGDRFLVLCNRVPHAVALGSRIESLTAKPVWVLSGDADMEQRATVLQQFKDQKKGGILIATPFFREGVDLPEVDSGFMAGGGSSDNAVWQGFCRMLTSRPGKTKAIVYDIEDKGAEPHEKDYLDNNFEDRLALYIRHGCTIERVK